MPSARKRRRASPGRSASHFAWAVRLEQQAGAGVAGFEGGFDFGSHLERFRTDARTQPDERVRSG